MRWGRSITGREQVGLLVSVHRHRPLVSMHRVPPVGDSGLVGPSPVRTTLRTGRPVWSGPGEASSDAVRRERRRRGEAREVLTPPAQDGSGFTLPQYGQLPGPAGGPPDILY